MRGAGDQMTVGERIKFYRRRRGLTQEVLANLVGRKVDWLSKIERGERDVRRLDVVSDVGRALRVDRGGPVRSAGAHGGTRTTTTSLPCATH